MNEMAQAAPLLVYFDTHKPKTLYFMLLYQTFVWAKALKS